MKKFRITNRGLYWGLIITFALLYLFVGFVSTLHSITFFNLANTMSLAILLGVTYEIGQASVLFSILMTKNKDKFLPWALMFLLTALQVTANVYASFKFMSNSGSDDWVYWQKSILVGLQAQNEEMYQIIISWIAGALLPIVALGMTALVAQNMKLMTEEFEEKESSIPGTVPDKEIQKNFNKEVEEEISKEIDDSEDDEEIEIHVGKTENDIYEMPKEIEDEIQEEYGDLFGEEKKQSHQSHIDKKQEHKEWNDLDKELETELDSITKEEKPLDKEKTTATDLEINSLEDIVINENEDFKENIDTFTQPIISDEMPSELSPELPDDNLTPYVNDGVEVIDGKAIPTPELKKTESKQKEK